MTTTDAFSRNPSLRRVGLTLTRRKIALILVAVTMLAALVAVATYTRKTRSYSRASEAGIKILAQSFNNEELAALKGAPSDINTEVWGKIKKRLDRVHAGDPSITSVQLLRHNTATGRTVCLVNSPEPGDPDDIAPGDPAHQDEAAAGSIRDLVQNQDVSMRFMSLARRAYFIHAYAIAGQRPSPGGGTTVDIIHYKIDAKPRLIKAVTNSAQRAAGVMLLFCLPLAVYLITRGNTHQARTLHELMLAIDQSDNAITISTIDKFIVEANEGMVRQRGYSREELKRMNWWDLFANEQPDIEGQWRALFAPGTKPYSFDTTMRRKNGEEFPARISVTPIYDKRDNKTVICCINFCTDLTAVDKPNRLLEQARQRAEEASRAKSAFLAMMSHEVRTPLNGIIGFASLLNDTPLSPEQKTCVKTIRKRGETLVRLASNILDISRIESGNAPDETRECDPTTLMLEVIGGAAENTAANGTDFKFTIAPDVPASLLLDTPRLKHILVNLAAAAAHYAPSGNIEISMKKAAPPLEPGDSNPAIEISVRGTNDNAPADTTATTIPLALMIARRLASLMGCEITEDSNSPSRFVFTFLIHCEQA